MNKNIFKFFDGAKEVYGDPLAIQRRLRLATNSRLSDLIDAVNGPEEYDEWREKLKGASEEDKAKLREFLAGASAAMDQAREELYPAIVKAFPLVPFNPESGEGATDDVIIQAMTSLNQWLGQKKTSTVMPPKSASSTGGTPSARMPLRPIKPGEYPSTRPMGELRVVLEPGPSREQSVTKPSVVSP
jgi:hypothetical protein